MLAQYEPIVKATITFIKLPGVKVNNSTVNEMLQNHPDWPSLVCISDSLNKWNLSNTAGKIEKNGIRQLPSPFIAILNDRANPLAIVKKVTESRIIYYTPGYDKYATEEKNDFLKNWDGIYLLAETNENMWLQQEKSTNLTRGTSAIYWVGFLLNK